MQRKNAREQARSNERQIRQVQRDIGRDRRDLEREEKRLIDLIRAKAKTGNKDACAPYAKQLVNVRKQLAQLTGMDSKMSSLNAQQKLAASTTSMGTAMATSAKIMGDMNKVSFHLSHSLLFP